MMEMESQQTAQTSSQSKETQITGETQDKFYKLKGTFSLILITSFGEYRI